MGRRRGEPQQTVSSGGTTAGRHSQKGAGTRERRASRQDEEERGEGREGEGRGGARRQRHYVASRACLAEVTGSSSKDLKQGVRLKIARALACRSRTQKACLCSRSSTPAERPDRVEIARAMALNTHWADGPHPPDGSATRGMKEIPCRWQSRAVFK